jgi:hypothetical protein
VNDDSPFAVGRDLAVIVRADPFDGFHERLGQEMGMDVDHLGHGLTSPQPLCVAFFPFAFCGWAALDFSF